MRSDNFTGLGNFPSRTMRQSVAGEMGMIAGASCAKRMNPSEGSPKCFDFCCIFHHLINVARHVKFLQARFAAVLICVLAGHSKLRWSPGVGWVVSTLSCGLISNQMPLRVSRLEGTHSQ